MVVGTAGNLAICLAPVLGAALVACWVLTLRRQADRLARVMVTRVQTLKK